MKLCIYNTYDFRGKKLFFLLKELAESNAKTLVQIAKTLLNYKIINMLGKVHSSLKFSVSLLPLLSVLATDVIIVEGHTLTSYSYLLPGSLHKL